VTAGIENGNLSYHSHASKRPWNVWHSYWLAVNRVYKLKAICAEEGKQGVDVLPGSVQLSTLLPVQASSMSRKSLTTSQPNQSKRLCVLPHTQIVSDCWQFNVRSRDSGNSDTPNLRHWVANYRLPHAPPCEK
jgi:hypothetical protein